MSAAVTATGQRGVRVQLVPLDALGDAELADWHRLRAANPELDSPYFHPGFAAAVHASGRPVEVAVARDASGAVAGLMPVHRDGAVLRPAGWPGADFQGPIAAPGASFPTSALLGGGVRAFEFDHLAFAPQDFDRWVETSRPSPYLDLTGGLDGYLARASRSGKDNMGQARRRRAKLEREHGAVVFAADVVDEQALDRVIELKREQYRLTGARDYFAQPDRRDLLLRLLHTRDPEFGGVLSVLTVEGRLVAAHFGMRAGPVLHWWFPVYDPEFSGYAPGWLLLRELVAAGPQLGVTRIDFGRGDDEYKRRAKTGEVQVHQGVVARNGVRRVIRRAGRSLKSAAKTSPLGPHLRQVVRRLRAVGR